MNNYILSELKKVYNKRILIYGTGAVARNLIPLLQSQEYNIVGVLDRRHVDGEFLGVPIIDWDDVYIGMADVLILAASDNNIKKVYDRIKYRCMQFNMAVITQLGEDLHMKYYESTIDSDAFVYYEKNIDELKKAINNHDMISFDLFDTLIMRKTLDPRDVFDLVEKHVAKLDISIKDFKKRRLTAEYCSDGTIEDIYHIFGEMTGLDEYNCMRIKEEEITCERECLIPRDTMIQMMKYAQDQGKKVSIISDMYLPADILESMLKDIGVSRYDKLYVSCDYGKGKGNGLFEIYKNEMGEGKYLHIGDDEQADGVAASKYGIDPYIIKTACELLRISDLRAVLLFTKSPADRLLLGMVCAVLFNDPFCLYRSNGFVRFTKMRSFVAAFISPILLIYMQTFLQQLNAKAYKAIIFGARDGYLLKRVYEEIIQRDEKSNIPALYVLASRKLCLHAALNSIENILDFRNAFINDEKASRALSEMLGERMPAYDKTLYGDFETYLLENNEDIIEKTRSTRKNYIAYLQGLGIDLDAEYLFCDLNGSGTVQNALNKVFHVPLDGFYLSKLIWLGEKDIKITTVFEEGAWNSTARMTNLLENIFTSTDPSVRDMDGDKVPVFEKEERSEEEIALVMSIQNEMFEFARDFWTLYGTFRDINIDLAEKLLSMCENAECINEAKSVIDLVYTDDLTGERFGYLKV